MYCLSCPSKQGSPIPQQWTKSVNFLLSSSTGRQEFKEYIQDADEEILIDIELWEKVTEMICRLVHSTTHRYTEQSLKMAVKEILDLSKDSRLELRELEELKKKVPRELPSVANQGQCIANLQSAQQSIASKLEPYRKNFLKRRRNVIG